MKRILFLSEIVGQSDYLNGKTYFFIYEFHPDPDTDPVKWAYFCLFLFCMKCVQSTAAVTFPLIGKTFN